MRALNVETEPFLCDVNGHGTLRLVKESRVDMSYDMGKRIGVSLFECVYKVFVKMSERN